MRAAVVDADGRIKAGVAPDPEVGPGEVRIEIEACGLCGSDLHTYHDRSWAPGMIPGHEIAGHIESIGPGARDILRARGLEVDARVVVEPLVTCRVCFACEAGREPICPDLEIAGVHDSGGFAEYITVPADRVYPVPADVPTVAAALCEPLAVALHALDRADLQAGERVLVLGGGAIGILCAFTALRAGAGEVVVRARYDHQQARARDIAGATAYDTETSIRDQGLESRFDLVLETVGGSSETLREGVRGIRPGGRIVILGLFDRNPPLDPLGALVKEATLLWSSVYSTQRCNGEPGPGDFERAVQILDEAWDVLRHLVTHQFPLQDIENAFASAANKHEGVGKLVVLA